MTDIIVIPNQCDPEGIDVNRFKPIIDHPLFQRLDGTKQTGLLYKVYRGATHTRFEHSLGTLSVARKIAKRLGIPKDDTLAVEAYALLHDIGHCPFSHNIEPLLVKPHDTMTSAQLAAFIDAFEACDIDTQKVMDIAQKKNPLEQIVKHGIIGADRLDYMFRDAHHIDGSTLRETARIIGYMTYNDNTLGVEMRHIDEVMIIQRLYYTLFNRFYHRKQYLINQRMLQRAVQDLLDENNLDESTLCEMVDAELEVALMHAQGLAKTMYERIRNRGETYKSVLTYVMPQSLPLMSLEGKPSRTESITREERQAFFDAYGTPRKLATIEDEISSSLGYERGTVIIAPIWDFHRLEKPYDCSISTNHGPVSLLGVREDHANSLREQAEKSFHMFVAVPLELRGKAYMKVSEIHERMKAYFLASPLS
jgi:HD superfamily phosphohydrolase